MENNAISTLYTTWYCLLYGKYLESGKKRKTFFSVLLLKRRCLCITYDILYSLLWFFGVPDLVVLIDGGAWYFSILRAITKQLKPKRKECALLESKTVKIQILRIRFLKNFESIFCLHCKVRWLLHNVTREGNIVR
jgi:hypothetical protein